MANRLVELEGEVRALAARKLTVKDLPWTPLLRKLQRDLDIAELIGPGGIAPSMLGSVTHAETVTGDGVLTAFTVDHGLGTNDVRVSVYDVAAPAAEDVAFVATRPTLNSVTVTFGAAPALGVEKRILVSR